MNILMRLIINILWNLTVKYFCFLIEDKQDGYDIIYMKYIYI